MSACAPSTPPGSTKRNPTAAALAATHCLHRRDPGGNGMYTPSTFPCVKCLRAKLLLICIEALYHTSHESAGSWKPSEAVVSHLCISMSHTCLDLWYADVFQVATSSTMR